MDMDVALCVVLALALNLAVLLLVPIVNDCRGQGVKFSHLFIVLLVVH